MKKTVNSGDRRLKFSVFADLHYKKGMYIASDSDLAQILERADRNKVDFVIHLGDFCNDYLHSPELTNAYLNNDYGLPVYGIYGNHELESKDNSMQIVTPMLTNRDVVWGTVDGKIGDGSIGYYYYDINGFRIICTDTNYSYNPETEEWEHNRTASWGAPVGNLTDHSFGPLQLEWLKSVLWDASNKKLRCIICTHASVSGAWYSSPDAEKVRETINAVNSLRSGTVLMVINGHLHTDHLKQIDGVVYFDVNTVRNGVWMGQKTEHYTDETFPFTEYDSEGNVTSQYDRKLSTLSMGQNTWFSQDPLSAIVTVDENGAVEICGDKTTWYADVQPPVSWARAQITGGRFTVPTKQK